MTKWLPDGIPSVKPDEAPAELARPWLATFGPATVADLKWWTGWSLGKTRQAIAALDTVEVELDSGAAGLVLAGDEAPVKAPKPSAALLPGLDPTTMGWADRYSYLGPYKLAIFDPAGNAGATARWDGRIVGGWCQGADGESCGACSRTSAPTAGRSWRRRLSRPNSGSPARSSHVREPVGGEARPVVLDDVRDLAFARSHRRVEHPRIDRPRMPTSLITPSIHSTIRSAFGPTLRSRGDEF
jgi:hypothetical protein